MERSTLLSPDELARLQLVGESPPFLEAMSLCRRIAACDATVLIEGETGTGKEAAARALHYLGPRRHAPFIPLNCGAIPDALVESELFGHVRGAFTDAREARAGVIAQAEGGTLFLDEIEAMSLRGQVALLRFLQDREYRPVGGAARGADVRVVASTNENLLDKVSRGEFRQDLLYRLNILRIALPPLRARGRDVLVLAEAFAARYSRHYRKPVKRVSAQAAARLLAYPWPGNVRELENLIHREVLLDDGGAIEVATLGDPPARAPAACAGAATARLPFRQAKASAIASFEKAYLTELLIETGGNLSLAARLSGKERSRLAKLAKKHGLARAQFAAARERA